MSDDPRVLVLAEMRKQTALLERILAALGTAAPAANDSVCNGPHGDPTIRAKKPRDWTGPEMIGRKFSECPPEYLDLLADRYDYFAGKDDADPKDVRDAKLDAARARAWAARLRAGWTAPTPSAGGFADADF